jgi:alkanesulfonate monooxygenase SsuD/methylene tetrahydromethanopterin reductase-like flavin-dependent oxidoreductase (luciferase family)
MAVRGGDVVEQGLLILGDHLPDPVTGALRSQAGRHRHFVELAARAEALGLDSVWLGEHHLCDYILSAPPVVLAAIAERTRTLRLGTGVTLLGSLDPVRVAEDYATVDVLSGGRVELVAGRGILRRTYADFGHDPDRSREIFEEHVELLQRVWSERDLSWSGRFRAPLEGATVQPRPVQEPHPPIWIGGGSSFASIDLAARLGLRLMLPSVLAPPESFQPYVDRYREAFARAGHATARMRVGACSHVHVARDGAEARRRWEPYHMSYIRWVVGVLMPWGGITVRPAEPGAVAIASPDYDTLLKGPSVCGSPAEVADRILRMREQLDLDLHIAMFDHGGIPDELLHESLELFAREVAPHTRA